jgi:starch synthase
MIGAHSRRLARSDAHPESRAESCIPDGRMSRDRLRILFVASEVEPFAKTGGLADVAGALPKVLEALGHDVRVFMPRYRGVERVSGGGLRTVVPRLDVPVGDRMVEGAVVEGRMGKAVPVYFLAQDRYYDRPGLYGTPDGDYPDNCERFVFFCRAALAALPALDWTPQVIHAHDWQTGLIPVYLETLFRDAPAYRDVATVFTVHNLAYQGQFWHYDLPLTGLGWDLFTPAGIEFYGKINFLKGGLVFSDRLTTVSPTYAREIQTPEFGERLDGVLRERADDLIGILNGIDYEAWNPATDAEIPKRFGPDDLEGKTACKIGLREEMGLRDPGRPAPVFGMVGRLADQKGLDLVAAVVPTIIAAGGQFVLLGTGDERYEREFTELARAHPGAVAVKIGFNASLARRIYAGADCFLMPSRYEPCGLGQLIALRYATIPIVRRTGGLADTIREWDGTPGTGTGFLFDALTHDACRGAVRRALAAYAQPAAWARLMRNGMAEDFSWEASAEKYVSCYRKAVKKARRHA